MRSSACVGVIRDDGRLAEAPVYRSPMSLKAGLAAVAELLLWLLPVLLPLLSRAAADCIVGNVTYSANVVTAGCAPGDILLSPTRVNSTDPPSNCSMYCPGTFVQYGTQPSCQGVTFSPAQEDPITCVARATCGDVDGGGVGSAPITSDDCGFGWFAPGNNDSLCVGVFCNLLQLKDLESCCMPCPTVEHAAAGASYTCTSAFDIRVSACGPGFFKVAGAVNAPDRCTACTPIHYQSLTAQLLCDDNEVSWLDAPSPFEAPCAHGYYLDFTGQSSGTNQGVRCSPTCAGVGMLVAGGGADGSVLSGDEPNRLKSPRYFALNESNGTIDLFISDSGNGRVMKWSLSAKDGTGSYSGKQLVPLRPDPDSIMTSIGMPDGIALSGGSIVVVENSWHRVTKWTPGGGWCAVTPDRTKCAGGLGMVSGRQSRASCQQKAAEQSAVAYSFINESDSAYAEFQDPELWCGVVHPVTGEDSCIYDLLPNCQVLTSYCENEQPGQSMYWRMYEQCGEPVAGFSFDGQIDSSELDERNTVLGLPTGVFALGSDSYISDKLNDRVMRWGASSVTVNAGGDITVHGGFKVAGTQKCLPDQMDCSTLSMLRDPEGVFVEGSSIFVVDSGNHRVVKWAAGGMQGSLFAGTGTAGTGLNQLNYPTGITTDWTGAFYIADSGNHRIVRWERGASDGQVVAGVTGQSGSGLSKLYNPHAVQLDSAGYLYVSDTGNNRLVRWCVPGVTDSKCAPPPLDDGQSYRPLVNLSFAGSVQDQRAELPRKGLRLLPNSTLHCSFPDGAPLFERCHLGCKDGYVASKPTVGVCRRVPGTLATVFDGPPAITCTLIGLGCTDPLALNFDPLAVVDNGRCTFEQLTWPYIVYPALGVCVCCTLLARLWKCRRDAARTRVEETGGGKRRRSPLPSSGMGQEGEKRAMLKGKAVIEHNLMPSFIDKARETLAAEESESKDVKTAAPSAPKATAPKLKENGGEG